MNFYDWLFVGFIVIPFGSVIYALILLLAWEIFKTITNR